MNGANNKADAAAMSSSHAGNAITGDLMSGGGAAGGCLAELPLHLTEKILYHISPLVTARLATVCKPWAAIASERLARPVPHLFVSLSPDIKSDRRGVIVSVSLDLDASAGHPPAVIPSRVRLGDTNGLRCVGALPSGRLAFANFCWLETSVLLVNPITGARRSVHVDRLRQINPVLAAGGSDSFVSVSNSGEVLIWRRNTGGAAGEVWSKAAAEAGGHRTYAFVSVANCNGCFYMMDWEGYVYTIDAAAPPPLRVEKLTAASLFEQFSLARPCPSAAAAMGHLVECDGEVLFVRRVLAASKEDDHGGVVAFCDHDVDELPSVVGFEVYRLDVKGRCWTEVNKPAGDRALFVSQGSSFAVRSSETEGCRSNCIYFLDEKRYCALCNRDDGNTWGVYSMEDRRVLFKHAVTGEGACSSAIWFLPRVA
ncbi:unnamed protein product [Urochloa humidicola]